MNPTRRTAITATGAAAIVALTVPVRASTAVSVTPTLQSLLNEYTTARAAFDALLTPLDQATDQWEVNRPRPLVRVSSCESVDIHLITIDRVFEGIDRDLRLASKHLSPAISTK